MAHRHNNIFGAATDAPARRAPSQYRPADSNIFGGGAENQPSRTAVTTAFPGSMGDSAKSTPRGDHGRNILDSKIDLGGGYGNSALNHVRPGTTSRHSVQENDKPAGTRGESVIVKQTETHNIFGAQSALREINQPAVPSTTGMTGKERRDTIAAWRNGKAGN
jgi:hypothetical protein